MATNLPSVIGVTISEKEIFIVQYGKTEVQVFDYGTFKHLRNVSVPALKLAWDITCSGNILFVAAESSSGLVYRVPMNSSEPMNSWSVGGSRSLLALSTLKKGNILVTCYSLNKLMEYTTTGQLVREIPLPQCITNPTHAIQVDNDRFLVCHIGRLHRVCLIDNKGQLIKSFGGAPGSGPGQLHSPYYLVTDVNGFCLVAEYGGCHRVILLNDGLEFVKKLIPQSSGLNHPKGLCLDRNRKKLFIADHSNARVVVFDVLP